MLSIGAAASTVFTVFDGTGTDFVRILSLIRAKCRGTNVEADVFDYNGRTLVIAYPTVEKTEDYASESAYKGS